MIEDAYHVKVKKTTEKQWQFLSSRGTNRLRVHAVEIRGLSRAIETAKSVKPINATVTLQVKVVTLQGKTVWTSEQERIT